MERLKNIIQIAGVIDAMEAKLLIEEDVDWLGFPLRLAFHQEDLSEEEAAKIIQSFPSTSAGVLITYLDQAATILELAQKLKVKKVQLHEEVELDELKKLKKQAPDFLLIKSLIVKENNKKELAKKVEFLSPWVDVFITDTYDSDTGACGATGKTHDWGISRALVEMSPRPVILAGGLCPENVKQAILTVKPAGVDVHTGVEGPNGRKDIGAVREFIRLSRQAFSNLS